MYRQTSSSSFWRNTGGAVAATYALALIPLIGVSGLAFDYARLAGMDTELQNAADQAALAGATQLDRTAGSMERAINAIQGGLVANETLFSNDGDGTNVGIDTTNGAAIVFYATRVDAEAETNGFTDTSRFAEAGYVGVTVETRAANYALTPVVGALAGDLNAGAVAGMGSALCRIPPLMICNPDEGNLGSGGDPSAVFDANRSGQGMKVVAGPSGGGGFWQPGNYGFLDLGDGANGVAEVLGWLGPGGGCTSLTDAETIEPDTEPGLKTGAIDAINTRFDVYQNANTCKSGGTCPSALNARKDLVRRADVPAASGKSCSLTNNDAGWHETGGQRYLPGSASPLDPSVTPASMGHPRDMCHAVSSAGACAEGRFGDGNWDRDAYFRSHYVRTVSTPGGAVGTRWSKADWEYNLTHGPDALSTTLPTRYQVYQWEIARAGAIVDGVKVLDPDPMTATGSTEVRHAKPICSQQYGYSSTMTKPDRREMTVAVVNCTAEGVKGKTTNVTIANWMDVFLVQPSADRDRTVKSDIYFEVIRETDLSITGQNNAALVRRDVPYLVK